MTFTDIYIIRLCKPIQEFDYIWLFYFLFFLRMAKTAETTVTVFLFIYLHVGSVFLAIVFKVCSIYLIAKKENFQTTLKRDPEKE